MTLQTERLLLRVLEPEDADALYAVLGDPVTMSHYPEPWSLVGVHELIAAHRTLYETARIGWFAMVLRETGKLIGDCGISFQNIDGVAEFEIGYHTRRDFWGKGYASEAAQEVKRYGFEELGFRKICSYMAADHLASRRVAEKNGMILEKTYDNPRNRGLPTTVYSAANPSP
jgi:[ribosomal protein S5]-alanine N-acetyltransferase